MNILRIIQICRIKFNFREFFFLAWRARKICARFIGIIENNFEGYKPGAERLCILLFVQSARLLEAILILCQKGLDEEARILTRSLLENTSYLIFILERDHEDRSALYQYSRALSDFSTARRLNEHAPKGEEKLDTNPFLKNKEDAIAYFRKKYGDQLSEKDIREKYALRPQNAAERVEGDMKKILLSTYGMFYGRASAVAHGDAPLEFVSYNNNQLGLKKWSDGRATKMCLQAAVLFSLCSLDGLLKLLKIENKEEISRMLDKLFLIIKNEQLKE